MTTYAYYSSVPVIDKVETREIKKKIRAYALLNDLEIERYFVERAKFQFKSFSKRPKAKKLLSIMNAGDVVITINLSDVFYSARESLRTLNLFRKHDIDLHVLETGGSLVTDNKNNAIRLLIKCFAEYETAYLENRNINSADTGHRRRGKIPYGFMQQDDQIVKNPEEQLVIHDMKEMHKNGAGYLSISRGIQQKHNVSFSHMGIKKILERNLMEKVK